MQLFALLSVSLRHGHVALTLFPPAFLVHDIYISYPKVYVFLFLLPRGIVLFFCHTIAECTFGTGHRNTILVKPHKRRSRPLLLRAYVTAQWWEVSEMFDDGLVRSAISVLTPLNPILAHRP